MAQARRRRQSLSLTRRASSDLPKFYLADSGSPSPGPPTRVTPLPPGRSPGRDGDGRPVQGRSAKGRPGAGARGLGGAEGASVARGRVTASASEPDSLLLVGLCTQNVTSHKSMPVASTGSSHPGPGHGRSGQLNLNFRVIQAASRTRTSPATASESRLPQGRVTTLSLPRRDSGGTCTQPGGTVSRSTLTPSRSLSPGPGLGLRLGSARCRTRSISLGVRVAGTAGHGHWHHPGCDAGSGESGTTRGEKL